MAINKVIYAGETLLDLTADTVSADKVLNGFTFHDKSGESKTGSCTFDSNTQDADLDVSEALDGKIFYGNGARKIGSMPNHSGENVTITSTAGATIPNGFFDGSSKAVLSQTDINAIKAGNIKAGISILGVTGSYTGAAITAESKTVTPTKLGFDVSPSSGYDYLSSVHVNPIPYAESLNAYGTTVTIG